MAVNSSAESKFTKLISLHNHRTFIIKESLPEVGWYLYALKGDRAEYDYLQDTLEMAKKCAFNKFGVPIDSWTEVKDATMLPFWCQ